MNTKWNWNQIWRSTRTWSVDKPLIFYKLDNQCESQNGGTNWREAQMPGKCWWLHWNSVHTACPFEHSPNALLYFMCFGWKLSIHYLIGNGSNSSAVNLKSKLCTVGWWVGKNYEQQRAWFSLATLSQWWVSCLQIFIKNGANELRSVWSYLGFKVESLSHFTPVRWKWP